jgi:hypothetical protein
VLPLGAALGELVAEQPVSVLSSWFSSATRSSFDSVIRRAAFSRAFSTVSLIFMTKPPLLDDALGIPARGRSWLALPVGNAEQMPISTLPSVRDLRRWFDEAERGLDRGVEEARAWLASPAGRRVRRLAARLLILGAPLAVRHPFFKTPVGRLVEIAGGAALLVKVAEAIRDWEPDPRAGAVGRFSRPDVDGEERI